jgi:hypothetical protein
LIAFILFLSGIEAGSLKISLNICLVTLSLITFGIYSYLYLATQFRIKNEMIEEILRKEFYLDYFFCWLSKIYLKFASFSFNLLEKFISRGFDKIASSLVLILSSSTYKLVELDLEQIEEKVLKKGFKQVYKGMKFFQTSYLNYNILSVVIGIILLLICIMLI